MALANKTFRIFVSSTFSDLKEERNALQKRVFPELRKLCMQHGFRFQAVDLRWGVSQEATENHKTMRICLREIERCQSITPRPNFIVLLGDRYGWEPVPEEIPYSEFIQIKKVIEGNLQEFPNNSVEFLETYYKEDKNAVPSVYVLQPVSSKKGAEEENQGILLEILRKAVERLDISHDEKLKYFASATHQEIEIGAMRVQDADEHVFGFLRSIGNLDDLKGDLKKDQFKEQAASFVDISDEEFNESAHDKLRSTKKDLEDKLGKSNIFFYDVRWENESISTGHLDKLCEDVLNSLSKVIKKEAERAEEIDELEKEIDAHTAFGVDRARFFIGRVKILNDIEEYAKSPNNQPLVIYGESGSGKSALMAEVVEELQSEYMDFGYITRFIGATPASSDIRSLIENICQQVSRNYGGNEEDIPSDYNDLSKELPRRLALATSEKPLVIFLDALDQLSETNNAKNLNWLPKELPENVKLIVSTISILPDGSQEECYKVLKEKLPEESLMELTPMLTEEGEQLLDVWLEREAHRTLQQEQRQEVLRRFKQNRKPLYLKLAYEEARMWKSYTSEKEIKLSPEIPGIINDLFKRLSLDKNHGETMVSRSLGYIAAGKNGLSEDELIDVLSEDEEFFKDFLKRAFHKPPEDRLPVIVWSRLYFDLEPYIIERSADHTSLMTFYHPTTFGNQVKEKYLSEETKTRRHKQLAEYFEAQDLFKNKKDQKNPNLRKLSELPYQQTYGKRWEQLFETLTDFVFLEAKSKYISLTKRRRDNKTINIYGGLYELLKDFSCALEKFPKK